MVYRPGDIVLVPFPFTDQSTAKQRPGVIVASAAYLQARHDLVLMPITSQLTQTMQKQIPSSSAYLPLR